MPKNSMICSPATRAQRDHEECAEGCDADRLAALHAIEAGREMDEERKHADRIDDREQRDQRLDEIHAALSRVDAPMPWRSPAGGAGPPRCLRHTSSGEFRNRMRPADRVRRTPRHGNRISLRPPRGMPIGINNSYSANVLGNIGILCVSAIHRAARKPDAARLEAAPGTHSVRLRHGVSEPVAMDSVPGCVRADTRPENNTLFSAEAPAFSQFTYIHDPVHGSSAFA